MIIPIKSGYAWKVTQPWGNTDFGGRTPYGTLADSTPRPHNGVDIGFLGKTNVPLVACTYLTIVKKVTDPNYGGGYGCSLWFVTKSYLGIYGHMAQGQVFAELGKEYKAGELLGLSDTTGFSSGEHVHWNMQTVQKNFTSPLVFDFGIYGKYGVTHWTEQTSGSIDPMFLIEQKDVLPVDLRYGQEYSYLREKSWSLMYSESKVKEQAGAAGFGPTEWVRMKNAFIYGYWDKASVFNIANYVVWSIMTKPEFLKRLGR